jgi:hypothetical protein
MTVRKQRGSVYGNTNFTDAVPLQRALNENVSPRAEDHPHDVERAPVAAEVDIANGFNPARTRSSVQRREGHAARAIRFTTPPEPSQAIFSQRDFLRRVDGAGRRPERDDDGHAAIDALGPRHRERIVELDQNRNADCTRSVADDDRARRTNSRSRSCGTTTRCRGR